MNKFSFLLLLLGISSISLAQNIESLRDEYLQTFSPESYHAFKSGEGILKQGEAIANNLSQNLANYQSLINTTDPNELLADFNYKMQNIESLEEQFLQENREFSRQVGRNLSNSISSGDAEATMFQALGVLSSMSETRRAKKELEAKKEALRKQRHSQMSKVYWKAVDFNNITKKKYLELAAYAETPKDEQYYLAFVQNLDCYAESMNKNWNSAHTRWLQNNCPKPEKNEAIAIENKFIAEDVKYSRLAEKKYQYYLDTETEEFRKSAISFAAAAVKMKPKAEYYYQIGEYYKEMSTILALSSFLAAKQLNPNFFDTEKESELVRLRKNAESEIYVAISQNDKEYLNSFLDAGLDKTIRINDKSILNYAITLDQPDAVQLILNKYVEGKSQDEVNNQLQKTIMMCAVYNSDKILQRFVDLGVNSDFILNDINPIEIAKKVMAPDVFTLLVNNSSRKSFYLDKYKDSEVLIMINASSDAEKAANMLDNLSETESFKHTVLQMFDLLDKHPEYIKALTLNKKALNLIRSNSDLKSHSQNFFTSQLLTGYPNSMAHLYLKHELVEFDKVPLLTDLNSHKIAEEVGIFQNSGSNLKKMYLDFQINFNIKAYEKALEIIDNCNYSSEVTKNHDRIKYAAELDAYRSYKGSWSSESQREKIADDFLRIWAHGFFWGKCENLPETFFDEYLAEYMNYQSIAHIAFLLNNPLLFHEIDKKFDLTKTKNLSGQTVFESMLNSRYFRTTPISFTHISKIDRLGEKFDQDRQLFYSNDFNFNSADIYLAPRYSVPNGSTEFPMTVYLFSREPAIQEIAELYSIYKIDSNQKVTVNGGTILHFIANAGLNGNDAVDFIRNSTTNKKIKNSEGKTAYKVYKEWLKYCEKSDIHNIFNAQYNKEEMKDALK